MRRVFVTEIDQQPAQWKRYALLFVAIAITLLGSTGCQLQALQPTPATPQTIYLPSIIVSPAGVAPGSLITVAGSGWSAQEVVQIGLTANLGETLLQRNLTTTTVNANGVFSATFSFPVDPLWFSADNIRVVAHSLQSNQQATAPLNSPTTVITPTTPSATGTVLATVMPTVTQVATASATAVALVTSTTTPLPPTVVAPPNPLVTATSSPTPSNRAQVVSGGLNLRRGPDVAFGVLRTLTTGEQITVLGRDASGLWLYVRTGNGVEGWLAGRYTTFAGAVPVVATPSLPTATATATPNPTVTPPPAIYNWRGEYYNNPSLIGSPVMIRDDTSINFDWGYGSPSSLVPTDNFSARWSRSVYFEGGEYLFSVRVDDGVRIWIDSDPIIDHWTTGSARTLTASRNLSSGYHQLRVEYFEANLQATISFGWERTQNYPDWKGEYFSNRVLSGSPQFVRNDAQIDFDWGNGAPSGSLPSDNFSVRWTRNQYFSQGPYRFHILVDDGMTLYVDGNRLIDQWFDGSQREVTADVWLPEGTHYLQVEYYESTGQARARVWWERLDSFPDWKGEYWSNLSLSGNPALVRNDGSIEFNWGLGSPAPAVPSDNFSVRWTRELYFTSGNYRFYARADDGIRFYLNDNPVINEWHDNDGGTTYTADLSLSGNQRLRVEYYERSGGALVSFGWQQLPGAVTPTWTPAPNTPTWTPVPPDTATPTLSATATTAATATPTVTLTPTAVATATATATGQPSPTETASPSPTSTEAPTLTATTIPSPTVTATTAPTATATEAATATAVPTATATSEPTATATSAPTETETPVPTATATATEAPTATAEPTDTVAPTATATSLPSPTATATATQTAVPPTDTPLPPATATPSATSATELLMYVDPASGTGGTVVTVNGDNFPANVSVNLHLVPYGTIYPAQLEEKIYASAMTNDSGQYQFTFTMPSVWPDGTPISESRLWIVVATDDLSVLARAPFRFSSSSPVNPS